MYLHVLTKKVQLQTIKANENINRQRKRFSQSEGTISLELRIFAQLVYNFQKWSEMQMQRGQECFPSMTLTKATNEGCVLERRKVNQDEMFRINKAIKRREKLNYVDKKTRKHTVVHFLKT